MLGLEGVFGPRENTGGDIVKPMQVVTVSSITLALYVLSVRSKFEMLPCRMN